MTNLLTLSSGAQINIFSTGNNTYSKYIIYFHGGGLVYGSKSDLPQPLLNVFLKKGYTVIAIDYPLAPNSSLKEILESNQLNWLEIKNNFIKEHPFSFCGRSAGSYLMLQLTQFILNRKERLPTQLINFYGYTNLDFIFQSRLLMQTTEINNLYGFNSSIGALQTKGIIWDDPLFLRYIPYINAVNKERLNELYGINQETAQKFSLSPTVLTQFPPIFSTASTTDQEVPFKYSKQLKKISTNNYFVPVYDLPHDFLKESNNPQVQNLLLTLADWLK